MEKVPALAKENDETENMQYNLRFVKYQVQIMYHFGYECFKFEWQVLTLSNEH